MTATRIPLSAALPRRHARSVGLFYETDAVAGIERRRKGSSFEYVDRHGRIVRDRRTLRRIAALAIPPAWTRVWISTKANAHLQATGRDAKGRKQYRYHPKWREVRNETKFDRMLSFGRSLSKIRARVERDFRPPELSRTKLLAAVVRLLDLTLIRVGNEEYARANGSYGLTTLREKHVQVRGAHLRFRFRGKSGKTHEIDLEDARLARIVRRCREIPGHELFHYLDENGTCRLIESADVNDYLRSIAGRDFTAKDFRTWAGTVLAASALENRAHAPVAQAKRQINVAVRAVAEQLGNTPAVCRSSYIHPALFDAFQAGRLRGGWAEHAADVNGASNDVELQPAPSRGKLVKGTRLHEREIDVLHWLQRLAETSPATERRAAG